MINQLSRLSRWDKPIGSLLLYIPCQWGLFCCTDVSILKYSVLFAVGSVAMRGAGCTVNDIWDYKFDKLVERTKTRPIASNQISIKNAVLWSGTQSLVGLAVLLQLPFQAQVVALTSIPLVIIYPYLKRISYFPQAALGFAFNYGALVGYSVGLPIDLNCILLYANGWCWTMVYDTLYAHQDKLDDIQVGVKSTALRFGDTKLPLYILTSIQSFCLFGVHLIQSGPYFIYAASSAMLYQSYLIRTTNLHNPKSCASAFNRSTITGILIAIGLLMDNLSKNKKNKKSIN